MVCMVGRASLMSRDMAGHADVSQIPSSESLWEASEKL